MPHGASPPVWKHFAYQLGLGSYLLPVVDDPKAEISAKSSLGEHNRGKVPSVLNGSGVITGFKDWNGNKATKADIAKWSAAGYGLCIQTRYVRGFDIDCADPALSDAIADYIYKTAGVWMPRRFRGNTGKQLLAFICEDNLSKVIVRLKDREKEQVEMLATGQQFIAYGRHSSGVNYEWDDKDGLPQGFPEISGELVAKILEGIAEQWGDEVVNMGAGARRSREDSDDTIFDEIAHQLDEDGLSLGYGPESQYFIECPWKAEHSSDSGISETAYFPKGTRGYEMGHFKCQHASCSKRTDADFIEELFPEGVSCAADFDDLPEPTAKEKKASEAKIDPSKFKRNEAGEIKATMPNFEHAVMHPEFIKLDVRWDDFYHSYVVRDKKGDATPLADEDIWRVEMLLNKAGFQVIATNKLTQAMKLTAKSRRQHALQEWLNKVVENEK